MTTGELPLAGGSGMPSEGMGRASFEFLLDQSRKLLGVGKRHIERLFGGRGIAGLYFGDFAMEAVEERHGLSDLIPLHRRSAAESGAEHEFIVAAKMVADFGGKFSEVADAPFDFHGLRRMEWRIGGSCGGGDVAGGDDADFARSEGTR